ncbi:MAG: 2-aminomuconic 6-semialdehyde dehydrogenase [Candidatus Anoxychlamydiales bacterium]|nr:2-aminomuconic 6-semialdehyde dehydrogenase [Candidatus Anoxychlamydiales bacterium]
MKDKKIISRLKHESNSVVNHEINIKKILLICKKFKDILIFKKSKIYELLLSYESKKTIDDEFERSIETLSHPEKIVNYLTETIPSISTFFPLNLPLYSFVLFAIVPSFQCEKVYVRVPMKMSGVFRELIKISQASELFPNIYIFEGNRDVFVNDFVKKSTGVIFTGKYKNAINVMKKTKVDLFIFNGSGNNPLVINHDADIKLAIKKIMEVKIFNNGQDCAGPDNILIHKSNQSKIITEIIKEIKKTKIDSYKNEGEIGPIPNSDEIVSISKYLQKHKDRIIYGGHIDFKSSIVYPTIILADNIDQANYEEIFAPIFFITIYESENDLKKFFTNPNYKKRMMYVSLFGTSDYITKSLKDNIILHNKIVMDIEKGYDIYGGYTKEASFVYFKPMIKAKPTLIPRDIYDFIEFKKNQKNIRNAEKLNKSIALSLKTLAYDTFGEILLFGFIFGSLAKGNADYSVSSKSDIDSFICLKKEDEEKIKIFNSKLKKLHKELYFIPDEIYTSEILTLSKIEHLITNEYNPNLDSLLDHDDVFWIQILSGKKMGVFGDKKLLSILTQQAIVVRKKICKNVLKKICLKQKIPYHISQKKSDKNKSRLIQWLHSLSEDSLLFEIFKFPKEQIVK